LRCDSTEGTALIFYRTLPNPNGIGVNYREAETLGVVVGGTCLIDMKSGPEPEPNFEGSKFTQRWQEAVHVCASNCSRPARIHYFN